MNSLKTVIRLHKWQLDEKRRALVELQNLRDHLQMEIHRLEEEVGREAALASQDFEAARAFPNYAKMARTRHDKLDQSVAKVDEQIAAANEEVAEAYRELKKFELAEEEREKREALKLRRKQEAVLDETASIRFRRRQEEENQDA